MWQFLNQNAGAVQAVSSIVGVVVTIVLVKITRDYVLLTKRLADAAAAQLRFQREAEIAEYHELGTTLKLMGMIVASLPTDEPLTVG
jgi:hypothetical protein